MRQSTASSENESYLDSQNGITAGRRFGRWTVKKRKMESHCHDRHCCQRCDGRPHRNHERTNWSSSLRLGKYSAGGVVSLTARMTGRHHGTAALSCHVMAAFPFHGSHRRPWKRGIAHSRAIVSSANARVRVTLMSVPLSRTSLAR